MIKKLALAIITTFMILISPASAFAATLSLVPPNGSFGPGCTFQVKINLDTEGAQTDGTDAVLLFDASKITPSQFAVQNGTIYPDYANVIDTQNGKIQVSGIASAAQAYAGSGTLATVSFQVNSGANGPFTIKFDFNPNNKAETRDSNVIERGTVTELLNSVTDGSYTASPGVGCTGTGSTGTTGGTSGGTSGGTGSIPVGNGYYRAGSGGGVGAPTSGVYGAPTGSSVSATPIYDQPVSQLGSAGSLNTTIIIAVAGGLLVILGIIGLMVL